MKVFVVGPWMQNSVVSYFQQWGWEIAPTLKDADLVNFNGGADISPSLYGCKPHPSTRSYKERDDYECLVYAKAKKLGKPMSGICRGGQLLNALAGGTMWQHVNNHNGDHMVKDLMTGDQFRFNSIHHQMMIPSREAITLAEAYAATKKESTDNNGLSRSLYYAQKTHNTGDAEVVIYWNNEPHLCFQAHPEFDVTGDTGKQFMRYIDEYVFERKTDH